MRKGKKNIKKVKKKIAKGKNMKKVLKKMKKV